MTGAAGTWINALGKEVTDPGGNLLHQLEALKQDWLPLVRTNTKNPHALWFAVYGHIVYHHGAGFREMFSRSDYWRKPELTKAYVPTRPGPTMGSLRLALQADPSRLAHLRPRHVKVLARALQKTMLERRRHWYLTRRTEYIKRTEAQAEAMFAQLQGDPDFYLQLDEAAGEANADVGAR